MDDLEFRRRVLSEPRTRDPEVNESAKQNSANAKFLDDALSLDARIEQAMRIDAPDDLADKILFQSSNNVVRPSFGKRAMGLAASVAFAIGLAAGQVNWGGFVASPAYAGLAQTAIEHVYEEEAFIADINENATSSQINAKLSPFGFTLEGDFPYPVYFLNHCGFGDAMAMHLVFMGEKGKVTLFITNVMESNETKVIQDEMSSQVMHLPNASLILVAEDGEDIASISEKLLPMFKPMG